MIDTPAWWLFIAVLPLIYWLLPSRIRPVLLAVVSLVVLFALSPVDMVVMLGIGVFVYAVFAYAEAPALQAIGRRFSRLPLAGRALGPVTLVLLYLFWFKYLVPITTALGVNSRIAVIVIPLGISYFSFKIINYALEKSRSMLPPHGLQDYLSWLFLMPTFTAGPIEPFEHYLAGRETKFQVSFIVEGGTRIVQGLVKKFVLGDSVVRLSDTLLGVDAGRDIIDLAHGGSGPATVWAFLLLSVVAAYLDFSGYSDIAIGASRLFGLKIIENFNYPFLATNLGDFWRRWHMSLVNWCRAYVFMPLVGITRNPFIAIVATFFVIGLWHAGSLLWISWGLWHGIGQVVMQKWVRFAQRRKIKFFRTSVGTATGWTMTMGYVALGDAFVVMYRQGGYLEAWRLIGRAFGL